MTAYTLNNDKMFVDITDGIAIVINSETGIYYGMNALGTNVFRKASEPSNLTTISALLETVPILKARFELFGKGPRIDNGFLIPSESSRLLGEGSKPLKEVKGQRGSGKSLLLTQDAP